LKKEGEKMRLNDGSICSSCKYFEHDCDLDNGCTEYCLHPDKEVHDLFVDDYDYEKVISECKGYENINKTR
jgi:hypothetical protein